MAPLFFQKHKDLPNHLFQKNILPRLPLKYLNRLKCISKELHSLISTDAKFAADQSRLANTSSSGFVYMNDGVLTFFPDPTLIGVPDPSLNFLNPGKVKIISCTNGLLLLGGEFSGKTSLCVCNPATKKMVFPESVSWEKYSSYQIGLAYEPCELPDRFTLVRPLQCYHRDGWLYKFSLFHSDIGKWTLSRRSVNLSPYWIAANPVCAKGVIYWCCSEDLLWYDTKRDLAGSLMLPIYIEYKIHLGVCAGEIAFCRSWVGGIEVWRLTGGSCWDRLHGLSWDDKLDAFNFCPSMQLHRSTRSEMFFKQHVILPVGFDGQFVYFTVQLMDRDSTLRLFRWETETGRVEEKGLLNLRTGTCLTCHKYANSMARVPQILNGTSLEIGV